MQYVDTGSRESRHALGSWLSGLDANYVRHLRFQSGYFNGDGLAPLVPLIKSLAERDLQISCVLGSNSGQTDSRDIEVLVKLIGCPRAGAKIAIVRYATGLFHPKVYHLTRRDGSQAAYVGSANLTSAGVTGLNVEAGLILDTTLGDPEQPLKEISASVDEWFNVKRQGVELISENSDIQVLVDRGVLGVTPPRAPNSPNSNDTSGVTTGISLQPLLNFAPVPGMQATSTSKSQKKKTGPAIEDDTSDPAPSAAPVTGLTHPSTAREPFPAYVLFAPGATVPTQDTQALSGSTLPSGATGLIIRLNRDSARHFAGESGTANVSVPVATISTLRFGIFQGTYQRPRAEFQLQLRYIRSDGSQNIQSAKTNIMAYGYVPEEPGHRDIRMVMPAGPARDIREFAAEGGARVPAQGDPMILEWPTFADPSFKATIVDPNLSLFNKLANLLDLAESTHQLVGHSACWLPPGLSPNW